MKQNNNISNPLDVQKFRNHHYSLEELIRICHDFELPSTGTKAEIKNRIAFFLETGEIKYQHRANDPAIKINSLVQIHKSQENNKLLYNQDFHEWLKNNSTAEQQDVVEEYYNIINNRKNSNFKSTPGNSKKLTEVPRKDAKIPKDCTNMGSNSKIQDLEEQHKIYIEAFLKDNIYALLTDAERCWEYKKNSSSDNTYAKSDLETLL